MINDEVKYTSIDKYGLSPAHAVHLERITYPPERRASISTTLKVVLCMLRAKGKYRKKWEAAVLKALSHVPAITTIILCN